MAYPDLTSLMALVTSRVHEYSSTLLPDLEIIRAINDGVMDVASKTLCLKSTASVMTTANSRLLPIDVMYLTDGAGVFLTDESGNYLVLSTGIGKCLRVLGVEYIPATGERKGLLPITPMQLGVANKGSIPERYFVWGSYVGIDPNPGATAYALHIMTARSPWYTLVDASDVLELPTDCIPLVIEYAIFRCVLKLKKYGIAISVFNRYVDMCMDVRNRIHTNTATSADEATIPDRIVPR